MSLSNNYENYLLDSFFRADSGNPTYRLDMLQLSTGTVDETTDQIVADVQTPPAGSGYSPKTVSASDWTVTQSGVGYKATNNTALTFDVATGNWGTITHFALGESTNFKIGIYGTLDTPRAITNGDTPSFPAGFLVVTIT